MARAPAWGAGGRVFESLRPDPNQSLVRRETGKEQRVEVPHGKGVANHAVPESCVGCREAQREALTGVRVGQPLSRESDYLQGADAVSDAEGNMDRRATASAGPTLRGLRPWHARTLFAREPGELSSGRSQHWAGPHREGEEP
jgi:hypothetical protein